MKALHAVIFALSVAYTSSSSAMDHGEFIASAKKIAIQMLQDAKDSAHADALSNATISEWVRPGTLGTVQFRDELPIQHISVNSLFFAFPDFVAAGVLIHESSHLLGDRDECNAEDVSMNAMQNSNLSRGYNVAQYFTNCGKSLADSVCEKPVILSDGENTVTFNRSARWMGKANDCESHYPGDQNELLKSKATKNDLLKGRLSQRTNTELYGINHKTNWNSFMIDALDDDTSIDKLREDLKLGADINERDALGNTPLLNSLIYGRSDRFYFLLQLNPNLSLENSSGLNALELAVQQSAKFESWLPILYVTMSKICDVQECKIRPDFALTAADAVRAKISYDPSFYKNVNLLEFLVSKGLRQ